MYFRNYGLPNRCLSNCLQRQISEDPSTENMVNGPKRSLLEIYKILRLFLNSLTANDKYSLLKRENLNQFRRVYLRNNNFFSLNLCIF